MKLIIGLILILALAGCMSDHEYMLRKANADNAAKHQQTFDVLTIKGPVTIEQGAELTTRAATQPFQALQVPDGVAAQQGVVRDIVTGAVIGYGLHEAGNISNVRTNTVGGAE